jgi:hypothetical protein
VPKARGLAETKKGQDSSPGRFSHELDFVLLFFLRLVLLDASFVLCFIFFVVLERSEYST